MSKRKPSVKIQLPNLLMIPGFSLVFSLMKIFGGIDWNWAIVLILAPMLTYIGWSIFFFLVVVMCIILSALTDKED